MTTARSPLRVLKQQARRIAAALKQASRGEKITNDPGRKIEAALSRSSVTFGVVMDDKILKFEMTWETIRETSERGIAEYILNQMREKRETIN